jgi:hypothetical protein
MRTFLIKHKQLTAAMAVALFVALVETWAVAAPIRGLMAANFDVRRGHYKILVYGLPVAWRSEYVRLLKERYGIETQTVALCIVSEALRSYSDNYNAVSTSAANRKFGHDVFEECAETATKNWEHGAAPKKYLK